MERGWRGEDDEKDGNEGRGDGEMKMMKKMGKKEEGMVRGW